ncbi:putative sulfate exporter family transporter [Nonomuraea sp. NPDC050310]|uniref:YeiH family protein n=1 Tax=Nonomuraea sp. NPDC050310 TaxID=3154935 RepID=UPI0033F5EABF
MVSIPVGSSWPRVNLPGIAVAGVAVVLAVLANRAVPAVSPAVFAVIGGAVLGNLGLLGERLRPGLRFVSKRVLRTAIVLLGLQIALPEVLALGPQTLAVVVVATGVTFVLTPIIGRRLGVHPGTALLLATGVSICGAAAIAAMHATLGERSADERSAEAGEEQADAASALSAVVLYGSLAIVALPLAASWLGLSDRQLGLWTGASVHEVAQVAAIGAAAGASVLAVAVIVKLARVVLLAPMVAMTAFRLRAAADPEPAAGTAKPPIVPLFVGGFLALMVVRSLGWVPPAVIEATPLVTNALLAAALFGLGAGIDVKALLRGGRKPMLLGAVATVLISGVSLLGVLLLG